MGWLSSVGALVILVAGPVMSFQDTECKGKSYYPMINTTSPYVKVLQKDEGLHKDQPYYSGHALFPDMKTYGCIENPNTVLSSGKRENMTALSAQYWCDTNGTTLSWVEYNVSSCGDCAAGEDQCVYDQNQVIGSGNRSVPFEEDGYTFGCSCFENDKFVTMYTYNASGENNGQFAMFGGRSEPVANCSAKDKETRLTMSGSCSGYYDNTTKDGLANGGKGVKRSRRVTCAPGAQFVSYQEYAGLDCSGQPYFNDTFDVDSCVLVRNYTRSFECERVGGTGGGDDDVASNSNEGKSTLEDLFGVNSTDFLFLLLSFLYFWFVVLVVVVGHQWATGTGCFKSKKVEGGDGGEEEVIPEIPGSPEAIAAEAAKAAFLFDNANYAVNATDGEAEPGVAAGEDETNASNAEEYNVNANVDAAGGPANEEGGDGSTAAAVEGEEVPADGAGDDGTGGEGGGEGTAVESGDQGYSDEGTAYAEGGEAVGDTGGAAGEGEEGGEVGPTEEAPEATTDASEAATAETAAVEKELGPTAEAETAPAAETETESAGAPAAEEAPAATEEEEVQAAGTDEAQPTGDAEEKNPVEEPEPEIEVGAEVL